MLCQAKKAGKKSRDHLHESRVSRGYHDHGRSWLLKNKMLFDMTWLVLSTFMLALYLCSIRSGTSLLHCDKQLIRELLKVPKSKIFCYRG